MSKDKNKGKGILLESGTNEVEFLRFYLGDQLYGVNVSKVRQVMVFDETKICKLPNLPECVLGNYNYRGECVPAVDLPLYYGIPIVSTGMPRLLILLEFNRTLLGFVVDRIDRIMRCSWSSFVPAAQQLAFSRHASVVGTIVQGDEMTPVLDVESMLGQLIPSASMEGQPDLDEIVEGAPKDARIVYCEDSQIVRKVLLGALATAGYKNVKVFTSGAEAFRYLCSEPRPDVDIIVSDIEMPEMDGLTLCKKLREYSAWETIPVFFFSSTVNDQMKAKCLSVGGTKAFSKPEAAQLIQAIGETSA